MLRDTVKRNTTAELVIEKILNMIKEGKLTIGDKLPPADKLTKIFGVGRSSLREAFRALSVLGYLEILPGRGTFIRNATSLSDLSKDSRLINLLNSEPVFDIMETREILECKCAELAAGRADPEQLKKLAHFNEIMQDNSSDAEMISQADLQFHLVLAEATHNEVIVEIMKLLIEKVELYADKFWATVPRGKEKSISTIDQTYYHVAQGDSKKAAQSMRAHLQLVKEKLRDVVQDEK